MASNVVDALCLLADDLCAQGCYLHAIKCLEALCSLETLPQVCGEARVRLSELLLQHTSNLKVAKLHAARAQLVVKDLPGAFQLKCRIAVQLGACHQNLGDSNHRRQVYMEGLELCRDKIFAENESTVHSWFCQFCIQLADTLIDEGEVKRAFQHLRNGQGRAKEQNLSELEIILQIFQTQALLSSGDCSAASKALNAALTHLVNLESKFDTQFVAQVRLHGLILEVLLAIKRGRIIPLVKNVAERHGASGKKTRVPMIVKEMAELLQTSLGSPSQFSMMPPAILIATVNLLSATLMRYQGKLDLSIEYLTLGLEAISDELEIFGMSRDGTGCLDGGSSAGWRTGPYLAYRYLLLESWVQISLLKCDYQNAQEILVEVLHLLNARPCLGAVIRSGAHQLIGLYLHSMGCYAEALKHFHLVIEANLSPSQVAIGRVCCALSELGRNAPESVSKGLDAVGPLMGSLDSSTKIEDVEQAALQLAAGNHELMCHFLNKLSLIQLEKGDVHGAEQMLQSCYTLAKQAGDTIATLGSLNAMTQLYGSKKIQEKVDSVKTTRDSKREGLIKMIHETIDNESHTFLENWDLGR